MFILPGKIESLMATLSQLYDYEGNQFLQRILVNARVGEVVESVQHDNWNGGYDGHRVVLRIPEKIFFEIIDKLDSFANELCNGLNKVNTSVPNEYFDEVLLEKRRDFQS